MVKNVYPYGKKEIKTDSNAQNSKIIFIIIQQMKFCFMIPNYECNEDRDLRKSKKLK